MNIAQRCIVAEREWGDFDIDLEAWEAPKPFGISGCFRLKNEERFMEAAIMSHLPSLDEAVLIVQKSDDDTINLAHQLSMKHPKIRYDFYPFDVALIDTPEHYDLPENSVRTMMHLTNWAISRCRYSWVAKIEGDVISLSSFAAIRRAIEKEPDALRYYGRIGLNVAGREVDKVSATYPRTGGWDEAVFNNDPFWHCYRFHKWESMNLHDHNDMIENMGFSFLHVKRCKDKHLQGPYVDSHGPETWVTFNPIETRMALESFNNGQAHPGPDDPCPDVLFEQTLVCPAK